MGAGAGFQVMARLIDGSSANLKLTHDMSDQETKKTETTPSANSVGFSELLSNEDLAFDLLWELCSNSWQCVLKDNDQGKQRIAERIKSIVETNSQLG